MAIKIRQLEKIFEEGYSLVDLLPYIEYSQDIHVLSDGSLGKAWKLSVFETEGRGQDYLSELSAQFQAIFNRTCDERIACQIILIAHSGSNEKLKAYKDYREEEGDNTFTSGKIEHFNKQNPKTIEAYLTIRFFPVWKQTASSLNKELMEHQNEFNNHIHLIEGVLQSAHINYTDLDGQALMRLVYVLLNPERSKQIPAIDIDERSVLRDQVLYNVPETTAYGFILEGRHHGVVSLKELPPETMPGMFSRQLKQAIDLCILDSSEHLMVVINFTVPPLAKAMEQLHMQKSFTFMHQDNWLGDKSVEAVEKKKELDETLSDIFRSGQKLVYARIHFVLQQQDLDKLKAETGLIINALSRLQCEAIREEMIGASLFLTCLPLNFDPYYEKFIRRSKRLLSFNLSDMLPLYGSFKGTRTPAQIYHNRRSELVLLDFFDSNINPHGVVIGASGSGKSFFMNDFILQNDRLGAHFFVLDKGDSYKKLCKILNGDYVSFDFKKPMRINPFIHEPIPENQSFLMSLLSQMATGSDERDRLTREEEGLLHKAVIRAYEQKTPHKEIVLSDLVAILNDNAFNEEFGINSLMGPTLALRLTPFTRKGPYGDFFDGPNEFSVKGSFTVFELANLSSYADLQIAVLLNLMFFMTSFVSTAQMKAKRKYLLIDEAWSLLKIKNTADFISNAFKTFRKQRCSVVAITQELADLTRHETGLAIVANASNKVFLKQEASLVEVLKERLSFHESIIESLKSIETAKGKYSEAFVMTDSAIGIIRLIPDPFLYWVANSEARNNEYLQSKCDALQGDYKKAIDACAKESPYGI